MSLELRNFVSVGRSLVAGQPFHKGDMVVYEEAPVLRWNANLPLSEDIETLRLSFNVPSFLAHAACAWLSPQASPAARRTVVSMCAPLLPISGSTSALFAFAKGLIAILRPTFSFPRLAATGGLLSSSASTSMSLDRSINGSEVQSDDDRGPQILEEERIATLVHVIFAAKVNAHRSSQGDWCLYKLASKLAHSCDPNLFYLPGESASCRFVALKEIEHGEMLTFSYAGGALLLRDHRARQERMLASHLFRCMCARCRHRDYCRQLLCPRACCDASGNAGYVTRLGSVLSETDADHFPRKLWQCDVCAFTFSDTELAPRIAAEQSNADLAGSVESNRLRYADLQPALREALSELGHRHWVVTVYTHHLSTYYRLLVRNGARTAISLAVVWTMRYLQCLIDTGVETSDGSHIDTQTGSPAFPHMLTIGAIIALTECWTGAGLNDAAGASSGVDSTAPPVVVAPSAGAIVAVTPAVVTPASTPGGTSTPDIPAEGKVRNIVKRLAGLVFPFVAYCFEDPVKSQLLRRVMDLPDCVNNSPASSALVHPASATTTSGGTDDRKSPPPTSSSPSVGGPMRPPSSSWVLDLTYRYAGSSEVVSAIASRSPDLAFKMWDRSLAQSVMNVSMSRRRSSIIGGM